MASRKNGRRRITSVLPDCLRSGRRRGNAVATMSSSLSSSALTLTVFSGSFFNASGSSHVSRCLRFCSLTVTTIRHWARASLKATAFSKSLTVRTARPLTPRRPLPLTFHRQQFPPPPVLDACVHFAPELAEVTDGRSDRKHDHNPHQHHARHQQRRVPHGQQHARYRHHLREHLGLPQ